MQQLNPVIKLLHCLWLCWKIAVTEPQGHISGLLNLREESDSKYKITKALQQSICLQL